MNKIEFLRIENRTRIYLEKAKAFEKTNHPNEVWQSLKFAHISAQPSAMQHLYVHLVMLGFAIRERNKAEIFGQIIRAIFAIPGSLSGKYPKGNPGTSDVSMFKGFEIPDELGEYFDTGSRKF